MPRTLPRLPLLALGALCALSGSPALASAPESDHAVSGGHDHAHDADAGHDEIVVTGHPPVDFGILAATTSIAGDALVAQSRGQIGETLAKLPGVSASSFAPGASRPVLRGFGGDRVAVLTDGIGSIDASNVSADHAVVFETLTVSHIDVFHGPAVLLFGGHAIGGAVNALDTRIPRSVPDTVSLTAIASYGTAADERAVGGALDFALTDSIVVHFDGNWRKSDDLRVGGFVNAPALRAELLEEAEELRAAGEDEEAAEFIEFASQKDRLPNSRARTGTLGAGIAYIDSRGDIGVSVQRYDTRYGVPLRPGAGHHHGEEDADHGDEEHGEIEGDELAGDHGGETVSIDLQQTRIDLRGGLNFDGPIRNIQIRGAYGDYEHVELEGDEVGTRFSGEGVELRADVVQAERNGWRGRSGVHYFTRKLEIVGAEAFVPDNRITRIGLFTLQSIDVGGGISLEAAGRYEHARVRSGEATYRRSFDLWSGAAGVSWQFGTGWTLGLNYTHGARAPSPEELLSDGLHVATQAYELGTPGFAVEKSDGFEAYAKFRSDRVQFALTGYLTTFDNFITALPTEEEREGFPVFRYTQLPARYAGFEASGEIEAMNWAGGALTLEGSADYTRARLKGVGPVPRIPPLRLRGGAEIRDGNLRLHGEVEWNDRQTRVAEFANPVDSFTLVNLGLDWHPLGEDGPVTLMLSADNIFDVVGRRAASFTRDFVPLAGRDVRVTMRYGF